MRDIFFDIETGGLSGTRNQILSLSWAENQKPVTSRYADLAPGSFLSRWSERKIWKNIQQKGFDRTSEKAILMEFLNILEEAPENTRLIGWNIGYSPFQQGITKASGFDIPFLISRAKQYGLDEKYQKVLRRVKIHDEGALWAYRIAKAATSRTGQQLFRQGRLHETVYMEAIGYMKQAGKLAARQGLQTEAEIAEALSREGIQFAGWKQESTFKLLFHKDEKALSLLKKAHESETDVIIGKMMMTRSADELDEAFLKRWNAETLENKIVSSLKTVKPGEGRERYILAMAEAEKWGIKAGVEEKLAQLARESGTPLSRLRAGRGIEKVERLVRGQIIPEVAEKAGIGRLAGVMEAGAGFARAHWGKIAMGASAIALLTLKPGAMFSGRDDEYNVIEGLPHGGQAERMRHLLTDFGSGWFGKIAKNAGKQKPRMFAIPKELRTFFGEAPARVVKGDDIEQFMLDRLTLARKRVIGNVEAGRISAELGEQQKDWLAGRGMDLAEEFAEKVQMKGSGDYAILSNPDLFKYAAKAKGIGVKPYLRGAYRHESFHKALSESGRHQELLAGVKTPKWFKEQLAEQYSKKGLKISEEDISEEFLAHSISASYTGEGVSKDAVGLFKTSIFESGWQQVRKIEKELGLTFLASKKTRKAAEKAVALTQKAIRSEVGATAKQMRQNLADHKSPVDLDSATMRAQKMFENTRVASKLKSDILEPGRAKINRKRRMQAKHKESQIRLSKNSLRPGRRHTQQAGRLVT